MNEKEYTTGDPAPPSGTYELLNVQGFPSKDMDRKGPGRTAAARLFGLDMALRSRRRDQVGDTNTSLPQIINQQFSFWFSGNCCLISLRLTGGLDGVCLLR